MSAIYSFDHLLGEKFACFVLGNIKPLLTEDALTFIPQLAVLGFRGFIIALTLSCQEAIRGRGPV